MARHDAPTTWTTEYRVLTSDATCLIVQAMNNLFTQFDRRSLLAELAETQEALDLTLDSEERRNLEARLEQLEEALEDPR